MQWEAKSHSLRFGRVLWPLLIAVLLAGTFNAVSVADGTTPGNPPAFPPDSLVDTGGVSASSLPEDPELTSTETKSILYDGSLLLDLLILSLAV